MIRLLVAYHLPWIRFEREGERRIISPLTSNRGRFEIIRDIGPFTSKTEPFQAERRRR